MPKSYGSSTQSKPISSPKKKHMPETNVNLDGKLATIYDVLSQPSHTQQSISKICGDLRTIMNNGTEICQVVIDKFITAVCSLKQSGHYYGYVPQPLPENILTTVTTLFSQNNVHVTDEIVSVTCSANMCDVLGAILKSGKKFESVYQTKQIISRVNQNDFDKEGEVKSGWGCLLVNYQDSLVYNSEILLLACSKKLKQFISVCINKKIQVTQECLYAIVSIGDISLVKLAILSGAKYDENALEYACKIQNAELIKLMLSNKVKPTTQCINSILSSHTSHTYNQKHISTAKSDLIALLVSFGYKITYDDIIAATKAHVELNNFKSFGIKLDEKFIEICAQYGFYPYENCGIKPNARCLQLECNKSGNLTMIKKLVGMGIKPDTTCLEYACKFKNNIQTLKFLLEKGNLKPNLQCLYNCSTANYNKTLSFITEEYIVGSSSRKELENIKRQQNLVRPAGNLVDDSDDEQEQDKEEIISDTEQADLLDYGEEEEVIEVIPVAKAPKKQTGGKAPRRQTAVKAIRKTKVPEPISDVESLDEDKDEEEDDEEVVPTKGKAPVKQKEMKLDVKVNIEEKVEEKKPAKKTAGKKITTTVVKVESDDEIEVDLVEDVVLPKEKKPKSLGKKKLQKEEPTPKKEAPKLQEQTTVKTIDSVIIPEDYNYRENKKISSKIVTAFNLGKIETLSFINLRKHVMMYIVQKNLIKDNMLNLDEKLQNLVNVNYTCVDSKFIDRLIYLMLQ